MAKDDYNVLVFRILLYLYGCLKRQYSFENEGFYAALGTKVNEAYLSDILRNMSNDGLIKGAVFTHVWGDEYVLASSYDELKITPDGIVYLQENSTMKKVKEMLLDSAEIIVKLIKIVLL